MNKKEISEIKKQLTPANCNITRICGCYVDAEKNKKTELKEAFLSLSEEEMFKYFEILRKTLSGIQPLFISIPKKPKRQGMNWRIPSGRRMRELCVR